MNASTLSEKQTNEIADRFEPRCKMLGITPKGRLLTNDEAAEVCGLQPNTLEQKRVNGTGPFYIQPEGTRKVLYSEPLLVDWLIRGLRSNTYTA